MKCPHCNKETFSGFNIFRSSEKIFICKKCNKKSFFPSEKKFKANPTLYTIAMLFMIGGIVISSPEIKFTLIGIALVLVLLATSEKEVFPFKNENELKRLKELLYDENEKIDLRLLKYPNAITWFDNVKNNSEYANKLAEIYEKEIKDYEEAEKWYKVSMKKNNYTALENLSKLYFNILNNKLIGTAYLLSIIGIKYTEEDTLKILQNKFNVSIETINEAYKLQLKMPNLPRRYKEKLTIIDNIEKNDRDDYKNLNTDDHSNKEYEKKLTLFVFSIIVISIFLIYNFFSNSHDKRLNNYPYAKKLYETRDGFESSYRLGLFYLDKLKDKEKALFWLKKSSDDGSIDATIKLFEIDKNINKDKWSEKALELGLSPMELAKIDNKNSNKWLLKASEMGNCKAIKTLAKKLDTEYRYNLNNILDIIVLRHKERNFKKAIKMYEKAYRNGCKEVVNDIALLYRVNTTSHLRTTPNYSSYNKNNIAYVNALLNNNKTSIYNNYKEAERWFIKGAKNGNAKSLNYLGYIYNFEKKNYPTAIHYYKKAYIKGDKESFKDIVNIYKTLNNDTMIMYLYLKGLKDNDEYIIKELIKYFYKKEQYIDASLLMNKIEDKDTFSTKNNITFSKNIIKNNKTLYDKINKKPLDYLFKKYKKLFFDSNLDENLSIKFTIDKFFSNHSISYELGKIYSSKLRDYDKALNNFLISYDIKEDGIIALKIGVINVQLENIKEGIKWLERAFNFHKEINAAFNLGQIYNHRLKNYKNAIKWYKKSYKAGDITSSYEIANIYENIFNDKENAKLWYKKGVEKGFLKSIYKLENIEGGKSTNNNEINEIIDEEGNNELILAIFGNNLKKMKSLIKKGVNINYINPRNNWTPLIAAIVNNNIDAVKLLVKAGVSLKKSSLNIDDPLWISFINSKLEIASLLIKSGANINSLNSNGQTLLHYFVSRNDYKIVKYLLDYDINRKIKNKNGYTALELAKNKKYQKIINIIKTFKDSNKKLSLSKKELKQSTPLVNKNILSYDRRLDKNSKFYNPILEKKYNSFKDLYTNNPKEKTDEYGYNDLMIAIDKKDYKNAKNFLENGANINHHSLRGRTPLIRSIFNKDIKMFELLIKYNPELNLVTSHILEEPIFVAFNFSQYDIVKRLIEAGANINVLDHHNNTLLHKCLDKNLTNLAKKLINKGIDTSIKNNNGFTVLELAKKENKKEFIKILTKI